MLITQQAQITTNDLNKTIVDIDEMDDTEAFDLLEVTEAAHARALNVVAKDASGNTYAIPLDNILSIKSSDDDVARVVKTGAGADITAQKEKVVVFGVNDGFDVDGAAATATATAVITLSISTDDGAIDVTKTVTVSNEASKVSQVAFQNEQLSDDGNVYELQGDAVTDLAGVAEDINDKEINPVYMFTKDQYGVYTEMDPVSLTVVNTNKCSQDTVTLADGSLNLLPGAFLDNEKVYLMYTAASGAKGQFSVTVNSEVTALDTTAPTYALTDTANLNTITLTIAAGNSDRANMYVGTTLIANGVDFVDDLTTAAAGDDAAALTGIALNTTTGVMTFTLTDADDVAADPITLDISQLKDAAGNNLKWAVTPANTKLTFTDHVDHWDLTSVAP